MRRQRYAHHDIGFHVGNNQLLICLRLKVPIQVYSTWSGSLHDDDNQYLLFSVKKHIFMFLLCV